ncbi:MAG: polysaccharide lyase [Myxococcota bacterium]
MTRVLWTLLLVVLLAAGAWAGTDAKALSTTSPRWTGTFQGDWLRAWGLRPRGHWGLENTELAADDTGRFPSVLRVRYPRGSGSPTLSREQGRVRGGAQFYADLGLPPSDARYLRYAVRFPSGFNFVKGGKLPGLYGGTVNNGRRIPDGTNGFSTRLMWRTQGDGEVYAYLPTSREHGTSLGRGAWRFIPGRWHVVEQELVLNTPGRADGRVRVWVDDKLVLERGGLSFRTTGELKIEGILFSTFFGGQDETWATPVDTHVDFAGFAVGRDRRSLRP